MTTSVRFASLAAIITCLCFGTVAPATAQVGPATATKLVVYNASNVDVPVALNAGSPCPDPAKCQQEDGCPTGSVQNLRWIDLTVNGSPTPFTPCVGQHGWVMLKRGHRVQILNVGINQYTGQPSACLQGLVVGFGHFGAICPDFGAVAKTDFIVTTPGPSFNNVVKVPLPNGSNAFECTLNLPGTVKGKSTITNAAGAIVPAPTQEAVDITCVNGANCTLQVQVTPPATGPFWQQDGNSTNFRSTFTIQNSWVDIANKCDNNCIDPRTGFARPGVYPYGCTECNVMPDVAPPCTGGPANTAQFCAAKNGMSLRNGCKITRNPPVLGSTSVQRFGGVIQVNYLGPLSPPGTCPPGSRQYP
jgi:hypothetical protein